MNTQTLPIGYRSESVVYKRHDYTNSIIETRSFNMATMSFQQIADEETKKLKERDAVIKAEKLRLKAIKPVHVSTAAKDEAVVDVKLPDDKAKGQGKHGIRGEVKIKLPNDHIKGHGKTKKATVREMLEDHSCTIEHIAASLGVSKQAATSLISDLKHDRVAVQSSKGAGTTVYFIEVEPDSSYSDRVHDNARRMCENNPMIGYENAVAWAMEIEPRRAL